MSESYYERNKEKLKLHSRERYQKNKTKHMENSKLWVENNREKSRDIKRKYKHKQKQILRDLSRSLKTKCSNCSCNNPDCIDWHHLEDKDKLISRIIAHAYSVEKFLSEVEKCVPLCANCHRKHHFPNSPTQYAGPKGKIVFDLKSSSCCKFCSESYDQCLDFHHRDESTKVDNISIMVRNPKYSIEDLLSEIDKCDIICVNCHRLL